MNEQIEDTLNTDKLQEKFSGSVDAIDAETASAITQARYRALEQKRKPAPQSWFMPAGVMATACVLALVFMLSPGKVQETEFIESDIELISVSEELEFYEDLEFYEWLEGYDLPT